MSATNKGPLPVGNETAHFECDLDAGDMLSFSSDLGDEGAVYPGVLIAYRDVGMVDGECKYVGFYGIDKIRALRDFLTAQIDAEKTLSI